MEVQTMLGDTTITKWKDNKQAAYSLCADDSLASQLDVMAPEMLRRGFVGTFYVNPGLGKTGEHGNCFISRRSEWEALARLGFDFANHTMHHKGAKTVEEADYEIGECMREIYAVNPKQKLQLFQRGGGTTWGITDNELQAILEKYNCVRGRGGGVYGETWHDTPWVSADENEFINSVDIAIKAGSWRYEAFHGVGDGGEWLPTSKKAFVALLDYLYEKRDIVWVDTNTNVHKYMMAYNHSKPPKVECRLNGTQTEISVTIENGLRSDLYDYPLTVKTEVPGNWERCVAEQNGKKDSFPVTGGYVLYTVVPNGGEVVLKGYDKTLD
jgi:hypothetical protein